MSLVEIPVSSLKTIGNFVASTWWHLAKRPCNLHAECRGHACIYITVSTAVITRAANNVSRIIGDHLRATGDGSFVLYQGNRTLNPIIARSLHGDEGCGLTAFSSFGLSRDSPYFLYISGIRVNNNWRIFGQTLPGPPVLLSESALRIVWTPTPAFSLRHVTNQTDLILYHLEAFPQDPRSWAMVLLSSTRHLLSTSRVRDLHARLARLCDSVHPDINVNTSQ